MKGVKRAYGFLALGFVGFALLSPYVTLGINESGSLPQTFFMIVKGQAVHQGDAVAFYPPKNPFYASTRLFVKRVGGVAGDVVSESHRVFYVNGQRIGEAKRVSSTGLTLTKGRVGTIPKNNYFVYTPHPRSFDSRYAQMGWVPASRIIGRAYPLF